MSTYWTLRCATHDAEGEDRVNHGQGFLREVAAVRDQVAALEEAQATSGAVEMTTLYGHWPLRFVMEHRTCPMELLSEYGDVEPLDAPCGSVYEVNGKRVPCSRQARHGGRHHGVVDGRRATVDWEG